MLNFNLSLPHDLLFGVRFFERFLTVQFPPIRLAAFSRIRASGWVAKDDGACLSEVNNKMAISPAGRDLSSEVCTQQDSSAECMAAVCGRADNCGLRFGAAQSVDGFTSEAVNTLDLRRGTITDLSWEV